MSKQDKEKEALQFLEDQGYYVGSLWHIDDVINNSDADISDREAYHILGDALDSEYVMEITFEEIKRVIAEFLND